MKPSIGASTASCPWAGSISGNGKNVMSSMISCAVGISLGIEVRGDERTEQVHADFLVPKGGGGVLPGATVDVGLVVSRIVDQFVKTFLTFGSVQDSLPAHQRHVEVVAVGAQVDHVEHAHLRPATVVGRRERGDAVGVHLLAEGEQVVPGRGDLVALFLEQTHPVVDGPRVEVEAARSTACRRSRSRRS